MQEDRLNSDSVLLSTFSTSYPHNHDEYVDNLLCPSEYCTICLEVPMFQI